MDSFPPLCTVEDQMLYYCQIESVMAAGAGGAEVAPSCPRCASSNTKFCYYNNYSLTQPRYLCKSCRRYWTRGGSLRNVPIGGGCRKSRRSKAARTAMKTGSMSCRSHKGYGAAGDSLSSDPSETTAEIDMATVFAKFLSQSSSSPDSVCQDSDPLPTDDDRVTFVPPPEKDLEGLGEVVETAAGTAPDHFSDQFVEPGVGFGTDPDGLFWSDTTSPEMSNFMTWQMESPFPSDEFWRSGFDFTGLEVVSGSLPPNAE